MTFEEYIKQTGETAIYPDNPLEICLGYLTSGLSSEVGEISGVYKKFIRGDFRETENEKAYLKERLESELGDVFWYLSEIINKCDLDPGAILQYNSDKLHKRKDENEIKSVKNRDD